MALLARREDRLADAVAEAGRGAVAVRCDVTDESSCRSAVEQAAEALGGIDALVYATGIGALGKLVDLDAATWRHAFDTNVTGAALVTAAAVPYLTESRGSAAYLSSVSASMTPPWRGLGSYAVSKAALDKLVEAWRAEHPAIGFTRVVVGECGGDGGGGATEFNAGWDHQLVGEVAGEWFARGYLTGALMDVEELVRIIEQVVRTGSSATIPSITLMPRHVPVAAPA